jgi:hypothetical protein
MKVIRAPQSLLLAGAAVFAMVPLAVVTAGVFSRHVWWDLPMREVSLAGWLALGAAAPLAWRIIMGRRGSLETAAVVFSLFGAVLVLRALVLRGTLQGVWSLTVMAILLSVWMWIRRELSQPYFDPRMGWFVGVPRPIAGLRAEVQCEEPGSSPVSMKVTRLGFSGVFAFAEGPARHLSTEPSLELSFKDRKVRLKGQVVRHFLHLGSGWGLGVRFLPLSPDQKKDLGDFVNAIRSEGHDV